MLVLDSEHAEDDAALFAREGIGTFQPFFFERTGRRPNSSKMQVAFSMAFARAPNAPLAGFFVCRRHFPREFFEHGVSGPSQWRAGCGGGGAVGTSNRMPKRRFLRPITVWKPPARPSADLTYPLAGGRLDVMTPDDAAELYGSVEAEMDHHPSWASPFVAEISASRLCS